MSTTVLSLRERNRLNARLHIQDTLYRLLEEQSYHDLSVAEIAAEAGVGAATIYRHFGTKERIVTWSELDQQTAEMVRARVGTLPPFRALEVAFTEDIAPLVDTPRRRSMMRAMFTHRALIGIAAVGDVDLTDAITAAIVGCHPEVAQLEAEITARVGYQTFDAALGQWQADPDDRSLASHVKEAFETIGRITAAVVGAG
jgi:AcrR family transcriptional regulator